MKAKIKSKVIIPHKKDCFMQGNSNPWSGIYAGSFYGNWNATPSNQVKIGGDHLWLKTSCNDPSCPAIKAVHSSLLAEA